ncbi:class I SAM-dependent methyltransferase [soil metagenome]
MSKTEIDKVQSWHEEFFQGMALDLWRRAIPIEKTEEEVAFLLETLSAPQGSRLLDVPCGNGRLSLPLSLMGYKVTAVDFAQPFIEQGKESAMSHKTKIDYIQGDMRQLNLKQEFDGAFCMGNSFGYFDRAGTNKFLQAIGTCLKSKARLVIDSAMIAECFLVNAGEKEWVQVGDMLMLIDNQYDCSNSTVATTYTFIQNGRQESRKAIHWIYTCGELCDMLKAAGFSVVDLLSSTDLEAAEPFALGADKLVLVAEKI